MPTRLVAIALLVLCLGLPAKPLAANDSPYAPWTNGPSTDPSFFMVGVWLQNPSNANAYKAIGINTYVGLHNGPTTTHLNQLTAAGMKTICVQNDVGLANLNNPTIIGWFYPTDEPDNAQPLPGGGYGPPVLPSVVQAGYQAIKASDPTRPVLLNLGQGVAWDGWVGRGTRTNHPEDYPEYLKGSDIGAFDFYPINARPEVRGHIHRLGYGVDRMRAWSQPGHPVWNYIETTNINGSGGPTPVHVRAEVWLSIVHGSRGIIYFAHEISPVFRETGLLQDATMKAAVAAINEQITALAPVLNSATAAEGKIATGLDSDVLVDVMTKRYGGDTYLFAVTDQSNSGPAMFWDPALPSTNATVEVLGEDRQLAMIAGRFFDEFATTDVHLYRIIGVGDFAPAWSSPVPEPAALGVPIFAAWALARRRRT